MAKKRKSKKAPSNRELLQLLGPRTDFDKIENIADADLLAFVGGVIGDRQRLEKYCPDRTVKAYSKCTK